MKTKLSIILLSLVLICNAQNRSSGLVLTNFTGAIPAQQLSGNEIFRFQPGYISLLDNGNNFNLSATSPLNSRWFSMGGVPTGPNRRAFGLRFQDNNKALTFGYQNVNDILNINPRIEWIGTGAALGNLEFRVANSFNSTFSTLVATMLNNGNTVFGDLATFGLSSASSAKVNIVSNNQFSLQVKDGTTAAVSIDNPTLALKITSSNVGADVVAKSKGINIQVSGSSDLFGINTEVVNGINNSGITVLTKGGSKNIGVDALAANGSATNIAIQGTTIGTGTFEAGIFGRTPIGSNRFAGYFDGNVFYSGALTPSDEKLKNNINQEISVLEKIEKLKPVTYEYKEITEMNLPRGNQHGFISQELATIFPELTEDISKPVFDKEQKIIGNFDFKAVNYNGLISILTAGIKELNNDLKLVKEELAILKNTKNGTLNILESNSKAFMEQNIPNPFADQTTIRYQLPVGINIANIMVMDLNGTLIKSYPINKNQSEIIIKASEIGKGLFIYSLVQNGQELITKKMIVK